MAKKKMNPMKAMKTKTTKKTKKNKRDKRTKKNNRDKSTQCDDGQETRTFTQDELQEELAQALFWVQDFLGAEHGNNNIRGWEDCEYLANRVAYALFTDPRVTVLHEGEYML